MWSQAQRGQQAADKWLQLCDAAAAAAADDDDDVMIYPEKHYFDRKKQYFDKMFFLANHKWDRAVRCVRTNSRSKTRSGQSPRSNPFPNPVKTP